MGFSLDKIKVSILCITYNQVEYIEDAIESFLSQKTTFEYEILIHDDASTDGTSDIVRRYQDMYPDRIRAVLQKENQYSKGIPISSTFLWPMVRGKYIAVCEGDDFWTDENKLQKQFDYMEAHDDCAMCIHNGWNISKDKKVVFYSKPLFLSPCKLGMEDAIKGLGIKVVTNSYFYRSEIIRKPEPNFKRVAPTGDYVRVIINALYGYIYYMPDTMSAHRALAKNSLTEAWNKNPQRWYDYIEKQLRFLDCLDEELGYVYTEIIQNEKIYQPFEIYFNLRDKEKLSQEPFRGLIKDLPLKRKVQFYIPWLYEDLRIIAQLLRRRKKNQIQLRK